MRLLQGDYAREKVYAGDPVAVARRWEEEGAPLIHVVDLDGAKDGGRPNRIVVAAICAAVGTPVEVSGGLRTMEAVAEAFVDGAARVQLGSAAVRKPALVREAASRFAGRIVVSIDARDGEVMTDGWTASGGTKALEFARQMAALGVPRLMFTDISRDGAMAGPNVEALAAMVRVVDVPVVASGGITTLQQLCAVAATGAEGAIIGKALYEGAIDLREAIAAVGGPPAGGRRC